MDLNWFRDLTHLAKTANFSQAAVMSNVSQPTLSRRIRALESWAGVTLVDRAHQPVCLTDAGKQILEAAEQAISRLDSERQQILDAQSVPDQYIVTFGAQHSIGWRFYPKWLQAFEEAYKPILSRLRADDLPNCLRDLCDGHVDYVIAYQAKEQGEPVERFAQLDKPLPPLESISIGSDVLVPVCKPRNDGKPLFDLDDASVELPFLNYGQDAYLATVIKPSIQSALSTRKLRTVYENSMAGALRIRARDGLGLAWLPHSLVAPDINAGLLCQLENPSWSIPLDIRLSRNKLSSNPLTRDIWAYLSRRQTIPLVLDRSELDD